MTCGPGTTRRPVTSWRALLAGGFALAPSAFAQTLPEEGDTVVVTGSATPVEYDKLGYSLTVIPGDLVEDQGYSYVPDVLRQVPGVAVNRGGAFGALTQVRIRGAEANHTLVLLDGIDVSSPDQGETDLSTLLSGDIERIEVLRGPQSGLYGSNALAGVVNLITRREVDGAYFNASIEGGEFSTLQIQGNGGFGNGGDYASAGFHMLTTEGYDTSPDRTAQGAPSVGGAKPGDDEGNKIATAYLRGGKALGKILRIDGMARYLNKDSELDGQSFSPPIAGLSYDDNSSTEQTQLLVGGSATLSLIDGKWETIASTSYVDEERRNEGFGFPSSPSGADSTRTRIALQSTIEFGARGFANFLTGFAETKKETYQNPCPAFCSPAQRLEQSRELAGFGVQYRAEIADQFFVFATARHDENDDFQDTETYSIAASWKIPGAGTRPHASFGTGVTNPTFFEQFGFDPGSFVGNSDLVPEEAEGWDIGVEQTLLDGRVLLDLTYFESTLENEIFTAFGPSPDFLSTPQNRTTESDRSGWEATFRLYPTADFDIVGSWTSLDATEPAGIEIRRPENQGAFDASWRVGGGPIQLNLGVTYNGEQVDTDFGTFLRAEQDPYTLVRLGISWQLNDEIELYGRIENLTDEEYEEVFSFLGAPRAAYLGVRFKDGTAK